MRRKLGLNSMKLSLLALFLLCLLSSITNVAEAREQKPKKSFALPTQVQLQPFQAPTDSRYRRMAPITVFLEAFKKETVDEIC
jgi:hypothetical protein